MDKLQTKAQVKNLLIKESEKSYRDFSLKLNPDINNILGIRIPKLRSISKNYSRNYKYYLEEIDEEYFEEVLIKGFIIGYANISEEERILLISKYIYKIDNWSTCDSFVSTLKSVKKYKKIYFEFIKSLFYSEDIYIKRFAIVMSLNYFIEDYYFELLDIFKNIETGSYYVDMALAWALSYMYIYDRDATYKYILENNFSDFIKKMTVQKIRDSKRVNSYDKKLSLKLK